MDEAVKARVEHGAACAGGAPFISAVAKACRQRLSVKGSDFGAAPNLNTLERIRHVSDH
jgi:hypothetical protein